MAHKHSLLLLLLSLIALTAAIIPTARGDSNNGNDNDSDKQGNVSFDDDDSTPLMKSDLTGWDYPMPKAQDPPHTVSNATFPFVVVDPAALRENKQHMHDFDRGLQHALWFLKKKADRYASNDTVFSVVHKSIAVPGAGDKHDYMSLARYYWPNESQPHGMPYIRHDGKVNPEIHKVPDYTQFRNLVKHVQFLALGYHYFDNETYAERATQRIHDWFINPETRMNPHLQYASLVRGYNTGRAKGIIDFHVLPDLLDSVAILQYSQAWQEYKGTTNAHIRYWFAQYIEWLTESPNGIYEMESHNNHGTYYDIQRAAIYRFLDKADLARQVVVNASAARVAQQILTSGEQYLETARPTSWLYSIFNLKALFRLAHISDQLGVDLYGYTTVDNKSIKAALDFVLPYALNESSWSFANTGNFESTADLVEVLEMAYIAYNNETYLATANELANEHNRPYNITRLTMPWSDLGDHSTRAQEGFVKNNGAGARAYYADEHYVLILGVVSLVVATLTVCIF